MLFGLDGVEVGLIIVFLCLFAGILSGFPVAFAIGRCRRYFLRHHRLARQRRPSAASGHRHLVDRLQRADRRGRQTRQYLRVPIPRPAARGAGGVCQRLGTGVGPQRQLHRQPHERTRSGRAVDRNPAGGADVRNDGHHARALEDCPRPADHHGPRVRTAARRSGGLDCGRGRVSGGFDRDCGARRW